ncbi:MAG TPA: TadE/TadG family type IV pilus assembly protein [Gaiellaceae bacterium]|nr:TadE/TadG family type IV pilus assembly protein [Gaiellaceae bacterium]
MRRARAEEGQAFVEFALLAPLLIYLIFLLVQLGIFMWEHVTLRDAVRAATRQATLCRFNTSPTPANVYASVASSISNPTPSSSPPNFNVTYSSGSCTEGATVTVSSSYDSTINFLIVSINSTINTSSSGVVE